MELPEPLDPKRGSKFNRQNRATLPLHFHTPPRPTILNFAGRAPFLMLRESLDL